MNTIARLAQRAVAAPPGFRADNAGSLRDLAYVALKAAIADTNIYDPSQELRLDERQLVNAIVPEVARFEPDVVITGNIHGAKWPVAIRAELRRQRMVRSRRSRDHHRFDPWVQQQLVEVTLDTNAGMAPGELRRAGHIRLAQAEQTELRPLENVADDVRPPVPIADDGGSDWRRDHAEEETRRGLGHDHPVQAILQIAMLVADMDLAVAVLGHAGRLEKDLGQVAIGAAGLVVERGAVEMDVAGAERRLDRVPRAVELARRDDDFIRVDVRIIGGMRRPGQGKAE